jgi:hypothetical protein
MIQVQTPTTTSYGPIACADSWERQEQRQGKDLNACTLEIQQQQQQQPEPIHIA